MQLGLVQALGEGESLISVERTDLIMADTFFNFSFPRSPIRKHTRVQIIEILQVIELK